MRIKPRQHIIRKQPKKLQVSEKVNDVWLMDFMSNQLSDGKKMRTLNVLDDFNREGLGIEIDIYIYLPSMRVVCALDQIIEWRGKPNALRCDNGPEYISSTLTRWAQNNDINLLIIQPGNPQQNAYIERYNRTIRYEYLEMNGIYIH